MRILFWRKRKPKAPTDIDSATDNFVMEWAKKNSDNQLLDRSEAFLSLWEAIDKANEENIGTLSIVWVSCMEPLVKGRTWRKYRKSVLKSFKGAGTIGGKKKLLQKHITHTFESITLIINRRIRDAAISKGIHHFDSISTCGHPDSFDFELPANLKEFKKELQSLRAEINGVGLNDLDGVHAVWKKLSEALGRSRLIATLEKEPYEESADAFFVLIDNLEPERLRTGLKRTFVAVEIIAFILAINFFEAGDFEKPARYDVGKINLHRDTEWG